MRDTQDSTGNASTSGKRNDQIASTAAAAASSGEASNVVITNRIVVKNEVSTSTLWKIVGVVVVVLVGFVLLQRARDLVAMLVISMFFSLALVPLVERLHKKYGWKRGAAVGAIYAGGALFMIVMIVFLIGFLRWTQVGGDLSAPRRLPGRSARPRACCARTPDRRRTPGTTSIFLMAAPPGRGPARS